MRQDDFPDRVRAERKARKMTQKQLADAAHVSLRMIQMFEGHKSAGTPVHRRAIADALGLDVDGDGSDIAAETRSGWPADVSVFLDMMGAYLMTMGDETRLRTMHDLTRQIFDPNR